GMKFKDADLIGIPLRITVGKSLEKSAVELKPRTSKTATKVPIKNSFSKVKQEVLRILNTFRPDRG
ncbi:MAG: proline--tRNA ligase, partial [Thermotogae bacterium]